MKKYLVICYSIHEKRITSQDVFNTYQEALEFIREDAQNTYEEELNQADDSVNINLEIPYQGYENRALLSSYDDEYQWTWDILELTF